jgi:hypothetical protein
MKAPRRFPTITEVAKEMGVSRNLVFKKLREFGAIGSNNWARTVFINDGYFALEQGEWHCDSTNKDNAYLVTTVKPKGRALIQDILDGAAPPIDAMQKLRRGDGDYRPGTR